MADFTVSLDVRVSDCETPEEAARKAMEQVMRALAEKPGTTRFTVTSNDRMSRVRL